MIIKKCENDSAPAAECSKSEWDFSCDICQDKWNCFTTSNTEKRQRNEIQLQRRTEFDTALMFKRLLKEGLYD